MRSTDPALAAGAYPERVDLPQPVFDRLAANLRWRAQQILGRCLTDCAGFADAVDRQRAMTGDNPLESRLSALRYRLRSDGFGDEPLAECFGLYCAAQARCGGAQPDAEALGAARLLLSGGIVDLAESRWRTQALALAACALAIHGTPVHILTMSSARSGRIAELLRPGLDALGVGFSCISPSMPAAARAAALRSSIVCGTHRELAGAYLQDRLQLAGKSRLLMRALGGAAIRSDGKALPMLPGLCFALVDDADLVMLDDAYAPVTISMEVDQSQERLLYEQALELARACRTDTDFVSDDEGMRLTDAGRERLTLMVAPLGGVWGAQQRREELVTAALVALHACLRDQHYRVVQGRVVFPKPDPGAGGAAEGPDPVLIKLVELKEGCRLSGARDVLARISVPRFFRRYLNLAGVCRDARGLEAEFWPLYGLKTTRVGPAPEDIACRPRMFLSAEVKRAAVCATVSAHAVDGAVVVAVRTPGEAQAVHDALAQKGIRTGLLRGVMDDGESATLASLRTAGSVAVALFPAELRGTKIEEPRVPLHLVVAELHDAGRHVSRTALLFGAGSCEQLLSLDEEGVAARVGQLGSAIAGLRGADAGELPAQQARWLSGLAQRHAEQSRALMRRDLILRDEYMSDLLAFSGRRE